MAVSVSAVVLADSHQRKVTALYCFGVRKTASFCTRWRNMVFFFIIKCDKVWNQLDLPVIKSYLIESNITYTKHMKYQILITSMLWFFSQYIPKHNGKKCTHFPNWIYKSAILISVLFRFSKVRYVWMRSYIVWAFLPASSRSKRNFPVRD